MKQFVLVIFGLFFIVFAQAQDQKTPVSLTTGLTIPILDNGLGLHVGLNPAWGISEHFYLEGQLSYLYTRVGASFLSGEKSNSHAFNALVGGRLYLNAANQENRFYLNWLLGGNYQREIEDSGSATDQFGLGFSGGGYWQRKAFLLGLSYDTPQNLVLKTGYVF